MLVAESTPEFILKKNINLASVKRCQLSNNAFTLLEATGGQYLPWLYLTVLKIDTYIIVYNFKKRNHLVQNDFEVSPFRENHYLINLQEKVFYFLSQDILLKKAGVSFFLTHQLKYNYIYISDNFMLKEFTDFKKKLDTYIDFDNFILCPIREIKNLGLTKSSNELTSDFKKWNQLNVDIQDAIYPDNSLENQSTIEDSLTKQECNDIVLIDDFSGTGVTLINFLEVLETLVADKNVHIFIAYLTNTANSKFNEFNRKKLKNYYFLDYAMIESTENNPLNGYDTLIKEFEESILSEHILGFRENKALITFYKNTPNNTYSSFWHLSENLWNPLFLRKQSDKRLKYKRYKSIFKYNIESALDKKIHFKLDILDKNYLTYKDFFLLLMTKLGKNKELNDVLGYNDKQLKAHREYLVSKGWLKSKQYRLRAEANELLSCNGLEKIDSWDILSKRQPQIRRPNPDKDTYLPKKLRTRE